MNRYRYHRSQRIYAILLLMVMMLQVGVKSFHHHHHEEHAAFSCSDCDNHRVHGGHILDWDGDSDDCQLCQMLQSPYMPAQDVPASQPAVRIHVHGIMAVADITEQAWCHTALRGPPSFL